MLLISTFFVALNVATTVIGSMPSSVGTAENAVYGGELQIQANIEDVILSKMPTIDVLPDSWDWRTKGVMSTDLNQHIPVYCGSCWAHAAVSTIADRIAILSNGTKRNVIPSVQVLLNCGTAGSCGGGDSHAAFRWIYENTIPDVTCQQYTATDGECTAESTCMTCGGNGCEAVENYPKISISEYGRVYGDEAIMQEIVNRGPVVATINANCIWNYTAGTVSQYDTNQDGEKCHPFYFDHAIQLSGWGTDDEGTDYWIGRNSWGTYWGDRGFFKIVRGGNYKPLFALWAVPDLPDF